MSNIIDILREIKSVHVFVMLLRIHTGIICVVLGIFHLWQNEWTWLADSPPLNYFLEALSQLGFYGEFMGLFLVVVGLFLVSQRLSTLGALLLIPILSNVLIHAFSGQIKEVVLLSTFIFFNLVCMILWDYKKLILISRQDRPISIWESL
ncbi:MAG: hypothetical protein AAF694_13245 [Bacteroidota bacterium]